MRRVIALLVIFFGELQDVARTVFHAKSTSLAPVLVDVDRSLFRSEIAEINFLFGH
jgi:hypothetical protein